MDLVAILVMWPGSVEQTSIPPSQVGSAWCLHLIGSVVSEKKMFEHGDEIWVTLDQGQKMTFTTCLSLCIHLVYNTYQLLHHRLQ